MAVLPGNSQLLSLLRFVNNGETGNAQALNRPVIDLVNALSGVNGVFTAIENLSTFSTIHKPHAVVNETRLLVHFDDGVTSSVVNPGAPAILVADTVIATPDTVGAKFYKSVNMAGSNKHIQYTDIAFIDTTATKRTISFWVRPSTGFWAPGGGVSVLADTRAIGLLGVASTTDYIEIGYNHTQEYFYAKFVGNPNTNTITLAGPANSYPSAASLEGKWFQLTLTWDLTATIEDLAFFVNGDLMASNLPVADPGRYTDSIAESKALRFYSNLYLIDEVRYDEVNILDEEVFSWYNADAAFLHRIESIIPTEFGHTNTQQLLKATLSGAPSGNFIVTNTFATENSTQRVKITAGTPDAGFTFSNVASSYVPKRYIIAQNYTARSNFPAWNVAVTHEYYSGGADQAIPESPYVGPQNMLASTTIIVQPNGNNPLIATIKYVYEYASTTYDTARITTTTVTA